MKRSFETGGAVLCLVGGLLLIGLDVLYRFLVRRPQRYGGPLGGP